MKPSKNRNFEISTPGQQMEKYKVQLEHVNSSLTKDPNNKQLLLLKSKLELLLNLKSEAENKNGTIPRMKEHTNDFPLLVGEACEIFDESLKYWRPGNIVSMTLERDFYIVTLNKDRSTHRVAAVHVRRPVHHEKIAKPKQASKAVHKPQVFKPRKSQPEPEGPSQWKKFADKMIKK